MDELSLPRLFSGFAAGYQGLCLRHEDTQARFNTAELSWWAQLGQQLGYWPYQDYAFRRDGQRAQLLWYPDEAPWREPLLQWERRSDFAELDDLLYDTLLPASPAFNARYCVAALEQAPSDPDVLLAARTRCRRAFEAQSGAHALLLITYGGVRLPNLEGADASLPVRRWPVQGWFFEAGGHEAVFHAEARIDNRFYRIVEAA